MAANPEVATTGICIEVQMTPAQCNAILEERLAHLRPVMECALGVMQHVCESLANGGFNWRKALAQAKKNVAAI